MNQNQISWSQYAGMGGFGAGPSMTAEQLGELTKALSAGNDVNNPGSAPGVGFPLRVESLERTLKNVTYRMEHIRLWKNIPKIPALNTVEEHNEISSYGSGNEGFVAEGALPGEDDTTYARKTVQIKFLGTTRRVTHPMTMIKPAHGNVIANETVAGTMWLLRVLERALFNADSSLSSLQFDGFAKLIAGAPQAATNVIDMRGQPLDEDALIDAALIISDSPNFGVPTHLHINPKVKADLVKSFFPKARYELGNDGNGMVGLDKKGFTSPAGEVMFEPNVFLDDGGAPLPAFGGALAPAVPTISTAAAVASDAASLFAAADAGSYFYKVTAHNDFGSSVALDFVAGPTAIAVAAGQKVTIGLTPGVGQGATKWYQVYRTVKGGAAGNTRLIARIPATGGAQTITDLNASLPFTTKGFMWQQNLECLSFKQLAPMLKIPLATVDMSVRWSQLLYGSPVLYAPGRSVMFVNIGRAPGSLGLVG